MKKVLYGSTALVAAGAMAAAPASAEEGVKLGLGGYYNTFFAFVDIDEAQGDTRDFENTALLSEGEVHFKGSTTLDNGITFGVRVELEAFQSGDQIDENYAFIEGSFGRFVIGGENTAAYMMQYGAPNVGAPVNSGWQTVFAPPPPGSTTGFRTPGLSTYVDLANDDHSIDYFTPRFSGFQVGVSYVPNPTINGDGTGRPADSSTQQQHLFSVGANFVESFGGVDIAVAGGYRRAEAADNAVAAVAQSTGNAARQAGLTRAGLTAAQASAILPSDAVAAVPGTKDPEQISAGLNIGFAGFTIGGSFAIEDSDRAFDGWAVDAGVSYSTGPWGVSLTGIHSEVEGAAGGGEDELDTIQGAVSYVVGPGIRSNFTIVYNEWDEEGGTDSDSIAGIVGMRIGF